MTEKLEFEFYDQRMPNKHSLGYIANRESPSAFNSMCNIYRFKVTVEQIEEPEEVIIERCRELYTRSDNMHEREALRSHCKKVYGVDITTRGDKR